MGGYGKPPNGSPGRPWSGISVPAGERPTLEHGPGRGHAGAVGVALGSLFKLRAHASALLDSPDTGAGCMALGRLTGCEPAAASLRPARLVRPGRSLCCPE